MQNNNNINYISELKGVKLEKLGVFMPYYGEQTAELVHKCSGRGENSWKKLMDRIHMLDNADDLYKRYINRLYESFELGETADLTKIISQIGTARRELGMKIEEQTTKWYVQQLSNAFLLEKVREEGSGVGAVIGYKLLFKLMPEFLN